MMKSALGTALKDECTRVSSKSSTRHFLPCASVSNHRQHQKPATRSNEQFGGNKRCHSSVRECGTEKRTCLRRMLCRRHTNDHSHVRTQRVPRRAPRANATLHRISASFPASATETRTAECALYDCEATNKGKRATALRLDTNQLLRVRPNVSLPLLATARPSPVPASASTCPEKEKETQRALTRSSGAIGGRS